MSLASCDDGGSGAVRRDVTLLLVMSVTIMRGELMQKAQEGRGGDRCGICITSAKLSWAISGNAVGHVPLGQRRDSQCGRLTRPPRMLTRRAVRQGPGAREAPASSLYEQLADRRTYRASASSSSARKARTTRQYRMKLSRMEASLFCWVTNPTDVPTMNRWYPSFAKRRGLPPAASSG